MAIFHICSSTLADTFGALIPLPTPDLPCPLAAAHQANAARRIPAIFQSCQRDEMEERAEVHLAGRVRNTGWRP